MIKPNDLSKISFFTERELPKQETLPSNLPSDFQVTLQNVKEESSVESARNNANSEIKEEPKPIERDEIGKNLEPALRENKTPEKIDKEISEDSRNTMEISEPKDPEEENNLLAKNTLEIPENPKNLKIIIQDQSNNSMDSFLSEKNNKGLSIASILLPVFQKEGATELFQEKLKTTNKEKTYPVKDIFPIQSKVDTEDLLKSAFTKNNSEQTAKKKDNQKETKTSAQSELNKSNIKINDVRQSIEELRAGQALKTEDKSLEILKNSLLSGSLHSGDSDHNTKIDKKNKPIANNKNNTESSKKDLTTDDSNLKDKIFTKENSSIQKISKEEVSSITEKLKRIENSSTKKEKDNLTHIDLIKDNPIDKKTEEKNSQTNTNSELKSKQVETKNEIKSSQKPETLNRNFQEIVKAAKIQIIENGKNSAEISLQPKDLGKITLFVSEENNRLEGKILVENEEARQMILGDLAGLKAELKAGGLDLFEIQVDINYDSPFRFTSSEEEREKNENSKSFSDRGSDSKSDTENEELSSGTSLRLLDLKV